MTLYRDNIKFPFILYETFSFSSLSFIQIELPLPLMNTVTQYFQNLQSNEMPLLKNIKLIRLPDFISCVYLYFYPMYTKNDKIKYHEKQKIIIELKIKSSRCLF